MKYLLGFLRHYNDKPVNYEYRGEITSAPSTPLALAAIKKQYDKAWFVATNRCSVLLPVEKDALANCPNLKYEVLELRDHGDKNDLLMKLMQHVFTDEVRQGCLDIELSHALIAHQIQLLALVFQEIFHDSPMQLHLFTSVRSDKDRYKIEELDFAASKSLIELSKHVQLLSPTDPRIADQFNKKEYSKLRSDIQRVGGALRRVYLGEYARQHPGSSKPSLCYLSLYNDLLEIETAKNKKAYLINLFFYLHRHHGDIRFRAEVAREICTCWLYEIRQKLEKKRICFDEINGEVDRELNRYFRPFLDKPTLQQPKIYGLIANIKQFRNAVAHPVFHKSSSPNLRKERVQLFDQLYNVLRDPKKEEQLINEAVEYGPPLDGQNHMCSSSLFRKTA